MKTAIDAVSFDFSQTLVISTTWEEIDVRTLASSTVAFLCEHEILKLTPEERSKLCAGADRLYAKVRRLCCDTNYELNAVESVNVVLSELGLINRISPEDVSEAVMAANRACLPETTLRPGAREVLTELREAGLSLSLISNAACYEFVYWVLERTGLLELFERVLVSGQCRLRKPDPTIYRLALGDIPPSSAMYVGDSLRFDAKGAKASGMTAVWLCVDPRRAGEPGAVEPDMVIHDLCELVSVIGRVSG